MSDGSLAARAWRSTALFLGALALLILVPAGTLAYWQGWLLWAHLSLWSIFGTRDLLQRDPALVERRLHGGPAAEREPAQKRILLLISVALCAMLVGSALDWRFGGSVVPWEAVIAAHAVMALGYLVVLWVLRTNSFAAATVGVDAGQTVVSTGPYAYVRHPMYAAALPMLAAMPVALGSWRGVLAVIPLAAGMVARLVHEEAFLVRNLAGYAAYRQRVHWRLVPGVW